MSEPCGTEPGAGSRPLGGQAALAQAMRAGPPRPAAGTARVRVVPRVRVEVRGRLTRSIRDHLEVLLRLLLVDSPDLLGEPGEEVREDAGSAGVPIPAAWARGCRAWAARDSGASR